MCTLTERVDPRIGPASAVQPNLFACDLGERRFQMILNRVPAGLTLPACKGRAVVGHE